MKKMLSLVLALMLCMACAAASAAGFSGLSGGGFSGLSVSGGAEALPDPAKVTDSYGTLMQADYAFSSDYLCDAYIYERPRTINAFTDEYFSLCRKAGYTVTETTVDGVNAYSIQADDAHYALLVTNFDGQMLLLVQKGMDFSPTPSYPGGHVEYVAVKQDCFACTNGRCDLCNGSGWYRMYGERVPCTMYCTTCNGLGYWYTTQPVWVP